MSSTNNFLSLNDDLFAGQPRGWIQWKGTQVCMDVDCACGASFHIDADFAYFVKCLRCNTIYEVGGYVKLYKLDYIPESCIQTDQDQASAILIESWLEEDQQEKEV